MMENTLANKTNDIGEGLTGVQQQLNNLKLVSLTWQQQLVTALVLYFSSLVIYRLFFHPLAKFPGPKLAAITRYVEGYYDVVLGGQYTWKIAELHKKYGLSLSHKVAICFFSRTPKLTEERGNLIRPDREDQSARAAH